MPNAPLSTAAHIIAKYKLYTVVSDPHLRENYPQLVEKAFDVMGHLEKEILSIELANRKISTHDDTNQHPGSGH